MITIAIKHPVSGLGALVVTGGLFWVLSTMLEHRVDIVIPEVRKINFTQLIIEKPPPPPVIPEPPKHIPIPDIPPISIDQEVPPRIQVTPIEPPINPGGAGPTIGLDGDVVPLVRIEPQYPNRAITQRIEGWVQLQFTITAAGTVRDPVVIDANPKGYFENAAVKAVSRWKYQPKMHEGRAVERIGNRVVLRFDLAD
jgi:protein TonB